MRQKSFFLDPYTIQQNKLAAEEIKNPKKTKSRRNIGDKSTGKKSPLPSTTQYDCARCKLCDTCHTPKIELYGKGEAGIMIINGTPGKAGDRQGKILTDAGGYLLRRTLKSFGIDMDVDCSRISAVRCQPPSNAKGTTTPPKEVHIKCCQPTLFKMIEEMKPSLIICLGKYAIKSIACVVPFTGNIFTPTSVHGLVFPDHRFGCWVGCIMDPNEIQSAKEETLDPTAVFVEDMEYIIDKLGEPLPAKLTKKGNSLITNAQNAVKLLEMYSTSKKLVSFDFETTCLSPFEKGARLITVAITNSKEYAHCIPLDYITPGTDDHYWSFGDRTRIWDAFEAFLASSAPKLVQNFNMEGPWSMEMFNQEPINFAYDTMIGAHIRNCRDNTTGLKLIAYRLCGHTYDTIGKKMKARMAEVPLEEIWNYNCFDVRYPIWAYEVQQEMLKGREIEFSENYMKGAGVLARMKHRGIQMDASLLEEMRIKNTIIRDAAIVTITGLPAVIEFNEDREAIKKKPFSWTSSSDIGKVLYGEDAMTKNSEGGKLYMGQLVTVKTAGGKPAASQAVFPDILKNPVSEDVRVFIEALILYRKVEGSNGTLKRIAGFEKAMDKNGRIHPTFTLNVAKTYRSSAIDPNVQNIPKHDPTQKLLRKAVIPSDGNIFLEFDKSSLEVRIIAMESKDPILMKQLIEGIDFHRIWTKKLYAGSKYNWDELTPKQQGIFRYGGKNGFVFASFYGSAPKAVARYEDFQAAEISLDHIIKVQKEFWETYKEVRRWQLEVVEQYNDNGYFEALPGFKRRGPLSLFQLYNNPTQGTGFCLFLNELRLIDKEVMRRGLKSMLILEVHDSGTFDAVPEEIPELIEIVESICNVSNFDWESVPTPVEWEIGSNWYDMSPLEVEV